MRRCVISNYHGARKCGCGAKPDPKRTSYRGGAQQGFVRDEITCSVITPPSCTYCIPRRTLASILDVQFGSKAYVFGRIEPHVPAVYPRDDGRSSFLAADNCTDAYLFL